MAIDIVLGLDVGSVRIGVALARSDVRIARPLMTVDNNEQVYDVIKALVDEHKVTAVVVGWPRGMRGQATEQTKYAETFAEALRQRLGQPIPVTLQDEALTSQKAEAELRNRNKPFEKAEVDALAATYILDDYLTALPGSAHV